MGRWKHLRQWLSEDHLGAAPILPAWPRQKPIKSAGIYIPEDGWNHEYELYASLLTV